ncbi:hypothetical protein oki361_24370 [Helicobacter pylori]
MIDFHKPSKVLFNKTNKTIPPVIFPNNLNVKEIKGEKFPAISIGFSNLIRYLILL